MHPMRMLTLVRHGQASFFAKNYDELSPLGEEQSRLLAMDWVDRGVSFDRVYHGPLRRQRDTARIVAETMSQAGRPLPTLEEMPDLDEFQAIEMMRHFLPIVLPQDPVLAKLAAEAEARKGTPESGPYLDELFQRVAERWVAEEWEAAHIESWRVFCDRIDRAMRYMVAHSAEHARIVAFTSGGVIAAALRSALHLSYPYTMEMVWVSRNSAVTEFLLLPDRIRLSSFNQFSHLRDPEQWTYR